MNNLAAKNFFFFVKIVQYIMIDGNLLRHMTKRKQRHKVINNNNDSNNNDSNNTFYLCHASQNTLRHFRFHEKVKTGTVVHKITDF